MRASAQQPQHCGDSKLSLKMKNICQVALFYAVATLPSSKATSIGQCVYLTASSIASGLSTTCLGVVDYAYFLPASISTDYLEQAARSQLIDPSLSSLPTQCQVSLKKAVCSNVYLKCPPNFSESNFSTFNYHIFSDTGTVFPLPIQRPCASVCQSANDDCLGLLNLKGKRVDCLARTDYSRGAFGVTYNVSSYVFPYTYDVSNKVNVCNSMPAVITVGGTKEPYLLAANNGACAGIVKSLYVPPANILSSVLAPMQGPYVVQSLIEAQLSESFSKLPAWLSASCHLSIRKYFCGSYMLAPQPQKFGNVLLANNLTATQIQMIEYGLSLYGVDVTAYLKTTFYLPSYPSNQVCLDYQNNCGAFINASKVASLVPHCESSVLGILQYPSSVQTIATLPISASVLVKYQTTPNNMNTSSDSSYQTICPDGFVVPDLQGNSRNKMIPGSGCAISCRLPTWTSSEFKIIDSIVVIAPALSVALIAILLVAWTILKVKDVNIAVFFVSAGANSLWFVVVAIARSRAANADSVFCVSNSIPRDSSDGISLCVVQAAILHCTSLVCASAFCCICMDLMMYMKGLEHVIKRFPRDVIMSLILPFILVTLTAASGEYGYGGVLPYCLYGAHSSQTLEFAYFYVPLFIYTAVGSILMEGAFIDWFRGIRAKRIALSSLQDTQLTEKTTTAPKEVSPWWLFTFLSAFFFFWLAAFVFRVNSMVVNNTLIAAFQNWVECIFTHFDKTNPQAWRDVCTSSPDFVLSFSFACFVILWTSCHSLLVAGVYLPCLCLNLSTFRLSSQRRIGVLSTEEQAQNGARGGTSVEYLSPNKAVCVGTVGDVDKTKEEEVYPVGGLNARSELV